MKKFLKVLVVSLALVIALPVFVACNKTKADDLDLQDGTIEKPFLISSASDFANIHNGTIFLESENGEDSEEMEIYTYYQLARDIDLNDLQNAFTTSSFLIVDFFGSIDGNGHTITMPNNAYEGWAVLFDCFSGELRNVTLKFNNVENETNFCYIANGETTFENVVTEGTINVPYNTTNYSPLVNLAKDDVAFVNCTNKLNILGLANYGSAFLGGYVNNSNVEVSFINCSNEGKILMNNASMLYGNSYIIYADNITIENCVNNGSIVGITSSGLFCGLKNSKNEEARAILNSSEELSNGELGTVVTKGALTNVTAQLDANKNVVISNSDQEKTYTYMITVSTYYNLYQGNTSYGTSLVGFTLETEQEGTTDIVKYSFIDKATLETAGDVELVLVEGVTYKGNSGYDAKLYTVTIDGTTYYYMQVDSNDGLTYSFGSGYSTPTIYVYIYEDGEAVGCVKL